MSSVLQNQLLKVEKCLLVSCLEKRGRLAGGGGSGSRQRGGWRRVKWGEGQVRLEERREEKESNGVRDRSDWKRGGWRRVKWGEGQVRLEERREEKESNGVRDRSDWKREGWRRVKWGEGQVRLEERKSQMEKRQKGDRWEEVKEGGDTGRSFIPCTGFASHEMICN